MAVSIQDQLTQSGLIDDKKAKQLKRAKHKQKKLARKSKNPAVYQHKLELDREKSEKIAKDRQLNLEKNKQAEKHASAAQIKQLIEMNIVAKDGDQKFSFTDANIIRHIYVSQTQVDQLSRGRLAIVTQKGGQKHNHVLVPMGVAEKIEQRDAKVVVFKAQKNTIAEENDPYANFEIPDDLTW
jgi:uncharacterized protein YaiL (DUF2058 family)